MEKFNGLPDPCLQKPSEITYDERDQLMHFNTKQFHHCYYNIETKVLYNEYCRRVMDNAYEYLLDIGMINSDSEKLNSFEN